MRDKFLFSDGQAFSNLSSTGEISSNIWDLEENASVDQCIQGCLMVTITACTLTSGLTEGMKLSLRVDDATDLATAKNGSTAGYKVVASKEVLKEEIVAGRTFPIPVYETLTSRSKYMGFWPTAVSTQLTGSVTLEAWFEDMPSDHRKGVQKIPS